MYILVFIIQSKIRYGNTKSETPVPVRSLKLSNFGLALGWLTIPVKNTVKISGVEKRGLR